MTPEKVVKGQLFTARIRRMGKVLFSRVSVQTRCPRFCPGGRGLPHPNLAGGVGGYPVLVGVGGSSPVPGTPPPRLEQD